MSKLLPLSNFAKSGLNSDLQPWDLPAEFATDIMNVRIARNSLTPFGGHSVFATLPVDFQPGYLLPVGSTSSDFWIVCGEDSVLAYDGATFFDISSIAGASYSTIVTPSEDNWRGCLLARIPVINNPNWYPEYWPTQSGSTLLEVLPWDATNTWQDVTEQCRIMRSHKQFLFALDLVSSGVSISDGVRWSTPADINGVPESWDHLDVTKSAGLVNLGGSGGKIIDGLSLRDAFVVYREGGISVFDYIGGQFIFQIRHLSTHIGLISPDSIVEVKGKHYFIGDGDILVNDGNSIVSLLHNRLRVRFASSIDPDNYLNSYAVKNNIANEIWFCIPESGNTYPSLAFVYNWKDNSWFVRDLTQSPHANYGSQSSPALSWDTIGLDWDQATGSWGQRAISPMDETIISCTKPAGAGQSGSLLLLDSDVRVSDIEFDSVVERTGFPLEGFNNVTTITKIYPHIGGTGKVFIEIGSQDFPGSAVRWKPPVEFDPSKDRKVDIRTTGELHSFKIYGTQDSSSWKFSGMDIEYVNAGTR